MRDPQILFVGGPTGGHLQPGLALARVLSRRTGLTPVFLTSGRNIERRILEDPELEQWGVEFRELPVLGTARPLAPLACLRARRELLALFNASDIRAVVALGGGESLVPASVARKRNCPVFLLEQNRILGRANRWLLRGATRIFLSFEDTRGPRLLQRRALRTGCPVRPEFRRSEIPGGATPQLLVLGGSQGSADVNEAVVSAIESGIGTDAEWVHVCGPGKHGRLVERYREAGVSAEVVEYETEVATRLHHCNLVIARAGGSTVAEVAAVGRPSIFLPYPHHRDRQQFLNAGYLVDRGAARLVENSGRASSIVEFKQHLSELLSDVDRLAEMAQAASGTGESSRAAENIADAIATHLEKFPVQLSVA